MARLANTSGCYIDDDGRCGRKVYGHLMCRKHYDRWRRHGDPLVVGKRWKQTLEQRFWAKVDKRGPDECWPWTAAITPAGYGQIGVDKRVDYAHLVSYRLLVGQIPEGAELDHLCHTRDDTCRLGDDCPHRRCVNPAHLEPVTALVNGMRSRSPQADNARKTRCNKGHEFTPENTYIAPNGSRNCRTCMRGNAQSRRETRDRRLLLGLPQREPTSTHCPGGHRYSDGNLMIAVDGTICCRACRREKAADRRRKEREANPRILKISDEGVADIRRRRAAGTATQAELAREYGVTFAYISGIVRNKTRIKPVA